MPRGNPNPTQTEAFKRQQFQAQGNLPEDVELAKKAIAVKLPKDLDAVVRAMPNRSEFIRIAIQEKLEREANQGMNS